MSQPVRIAVIGCGSVSDKYFKLADQLRGRGLACAHSPRAGSAHGKRRIRAETIVGGSRVVAVPLGVGDLCESLRCVER